MSHEQFRTVIDALYDCATECLHCENACLDEQDVKGLARCIRLDRECAETCLFSAKMLSAGTEFSGEVMNLCANVCDACAEECGKHAHHMEHCRVCAEACRRCAAECRSAVKINVI